MVQSAVVHDDFVIPTAKAILDGFQTAGFIYLQNIPMSPAERQHIFETSAKYFRLPMTEKLKHSMLSVHSNKGYSAKGQEKLGEESPDIKETLHFGRENDPQYENIWPEESGELVSFKEDILRFYGFCSGLADKLMRAIALGLGIEEGYFNRFMTFGDHKLRLLHYPEVSKEVFKMNNSQVRAGAHTDYGAITLLFQDCRGGLQVKTPSGEFLDAAPIENAVIVNAGDLLARWSNDVFKSTVHRVVEPPISQGGDSYPARYSIAFFANPNEKAYIDAIPGTFVTESDKKYKGTTSGEYYIERLRATCLRTSVENQPINLEPSVGFHSGFRNDPL
ncbi:hypothetical protein BDW59DRAFT_174278 [Aspergillus cavernicola]|uniref:Fe2OG dioxygenase domain-containing protein n=1 Tax=Aspergillus cavernicola TaxID=176166 RepID=A0ABR4I0U2_9EURO